MGDGCTKRRGTSKLWRSLAIAVVMAVAWAWVTTEPRAQGTGQAVPSRNVNVISGTGPDGDWTLQRQNEPSGACSSRNPLNCLVGANDYRSVDIPLPP